jgi:hypothetical protein
LLVEVALEDPIRHCWIGQGVSAPSMCRPDASVVAAGAEEYELGAPRSAEAGHRQRSDSSVWTELSIGTTSVPQWVPGAASPWNSDVNKYSKVADIGDFELLEDGVQPEIGDVTVVMPDSTTAYTQSGVHPCGC